jgi:hypothetical protein
MEKAAKDCISGLKSALISGKWADFLRGALPRSLVGKLLLSGALLASISGVWYTFVYFRRAVQRPRLSYQPNARCVASCLLFLILFIFLMKKNIFLNYEQSCPTETGALLAPVRC